MKQKLLSLLLLLAVAAQPLAARGSKDSKPQKKVTQYKGYKLVWHDEFDKDGRPAPHWDFEQGFVRNREAQWYQPDNATVKDGLLVIEGRKERVANPRFKEGSKDWRNQEYAEYTSASLTTRKSFTFKYGRVEVRARIPAFDGAWPAIWLLGNKGPWPQNGEIDIMEYYIRDGKPSILANACWSSSRRHNAVWDTAVVPFSQFTDRDPDWASKFHLWRMDWDADFIRIYLDGELMNEIDLAQTCNQGCDGNTENPFSNDIEDFQDYLLLNLAMGSSGGKIDESRLPFHYYVDFVRVYQKE